MEPIEKTTADKKKYSQLSYEEVLDYIGIDDLMLFSEEGDIPMKEIDKDISKNLIKLIRAYGVVDIVIYNIATKHFDKKVKIRSEEQINNDVKGLVEFVIVSDKLILITSEAKKKQDWDQGRTQLLMQLYNAYIKNIKLGASKNHVVYGIVTTGYS